MTKAIALPAYVSNEFARLRQITVYRSGTALANHIRDAHQGKFCEECAACREIREKSRDDR